MRSHVEAAAGSDREAAGPALAASSVGLQSRVLELQRSAGNAAFCRLMRAQGSPARTPAGADGDVIAEAKRMLAENDRGPGAMTALVRRFGKGRVAAPQNHATLLAAGARGYAFKYLAGSGYLSIGEDFVERLAGGDLEALKAELAKAVAEIDAPSAAGAAAAPAGRPATGSSASAPQAEEPRKKKEARNPRNGAFRRRVRELLAPIQVEHEVKEGTAEFDKLLPPWQVQYEREAKAREHYAKHNADVTSSKYSTCITFMNNVLNEAKKQAGGRVERIGSDAETFLKGVPGAWNAGAELGTYDPEEGDVYVFYFPADHPEPKKRNTFSHTGFIRSVGPVGSNGMQTWVTVDAGQGTAGALRVTSATPMVKDGQPVLDKDKKPVMKYTYEVVVKGEESIKARVRTFDTKKKLMYGGENEDKDPRVLKGWVDIDQAVTLPKAK
jgi:hypothetical protein